MRASGNRVSRVVINKLMAEAVSSLRFIGQPTPKDLRQANEGHRTILERISAGDPEGAAQTMNEHIVSSWLRRRPANASNPRLDAFRRRHV
jgi:DNA-binding FadR family transcriptional regulator